MSDVEKLEPARTWSMILYPDNEAHVNAVSSIANLYDYMVCLHDRDVYCATDEAKNPDHKSGDLKKPHWHVVLRNKNAIHRSALAKKIGVEEHLIQKVDHLDAALRYPLHLNDKTKAAYSVDDCQGTLVPRLQELLQRSEKSETERVCDIIGFIDRMPYYSVRSLSIYCATSGLWDVYRRASGVFIRIMGEKFPEEKG